MDREVSIFITDVLAQAQSISHVKLSPLVTVTVCMVVNNQPKLWFDLPMKTAIPCFCHLVVNVMNSQVKENSTLLNAVERMGLFLVLLEPI